MILDCIVNIRTSYIEIGVKDIENTIEFNFINQLIISMDLLEKASLFHNWKSKRQYRNLSVLDLYFIYNINSVLVGNIDFKVIANYFWDNLEEESYKYNTLDALGDF